LKELGSKKDDDAQKTGFYPGPDDPQGIRREVKRPTTRPNALKKQVKVNGFAEIARYLRRPSPYEAACWGERREVMMGNEAGCSVYLRSTGWPKNGDGWARHGSESQPRRGIDEKRQITRLGDKGGRGRERPKRSVNPKHS